MKSYAKKMSNKKVKFRFYSIFSDEMVYFYDSGSKTMKKATIRGIISEEEDHYEIVLDLN